MFAQLDSKTGDRRWWTVPAAYLLEVLVVAALALVPLFNTDALPKIIDVWPLPPPPAGPPRAPRAAVKAVRLRAALDPMTAPPVIPKNITPLRDEPPPPQDDSAGVVGDVPGGVPDGSRYGIPGGLGLADGTPPPPPAPARNAGTTRIKVGGQVEAAKLLFQPKPEYPPLARMARIQGTVRLEAIISRDGSIEDLKVLSGHPLLVKSALDAVRRWRYQPTLLNGDPVEVVTEIDVIFNLAD